MAAPNLRRARTMVEWFLHVVAPSSDGWWPAGMRLGHDAAFFVAKVWCEIPPVTGARPSLNNRLARERERRIIAAFGNANADKARRIGVR